MSKDAPADPVGQTSDSLFGEMVHSKTWRRVVFFSAVAGAAAVALNLSGEATGGKLEDFFRIFDAPLIALLDERNGPFSFLANASQNVAILFAMVALTCYWTVIALFLASLFCLVRMGAIKRMFCDKACRRTLFVGASGGIFIAGLNLLAAFSGRAEPQVFFETLDRPVISLLKAAQERSYFPANPTAKLNWSIGALVIYWFMERGGQWGVRLGKG